MGLIRAKYRGSCAACGKPIYIGENCYYDPGDRKTVCVSCGGLGRAATDDSSGPGPIASALAIRGTSREVIRQLRSQVEKQIVSLKDALRIAETQLLALRQIEDQQQESGKETVR